jgi:hypothetical protein
LNPHLLVRDNHLFLLLPILFAPIFILILVNLHLGNVLVLEIAFTEVLLDYHPCFPGICPRFGFLDDAHHPQGIVLRSQQRLLDDSRSVVCQIDLLLLLLVYLLKDVVVERVDLVV